MEAGETLEKLVEFSRFHSVQLAFIYPSLRMQVQPPLLLLFSPLVGFVSGFAFLKALTTGCFDFTIKNAGPDISVLRGKM